MSENENLIEYYKELLIIQYNDKPKAKATIDALVRASMIFDVANKVRDGFNIETAVGKQQDILGKYLGTPRVITGTSFSRDYFGFAEYGASAPFDFYPLLKYGQEAPDAQFRNYTESTQSLLALNDEEYRIIQKLAVVRNNSNASVKDIDDILFQLFGAECYFIDRMNMTVVSYMVGEKWARLFNIAKSTGLLPNPAGVGTGLIVVPDINNIFAYSLYGGDAPSFAVGMINYFFTWKTRGDKKLIPASYSSSVAALTESLIVAQTFELGGANYLRAYSFTGTDWIQEGVSFLHTETPNHKAVGLNGTSFAMIYDSIQKYSFNGTTFVKIGNALPLADTAYKSCGLSENRVCIYTLGKKIQTYEFDGTDWAQVGNDLSFFELFMAVTKLTPSRVVAYASVATRFYVFDFDGTDWAQTGGPSDSGQSPFGSFVSLAGLTDTRFTLANDAGLVRVFDFDGTDYTKIGDDYTIPAHTNNIPARLTDERIVVLGTNEASLQSYEFSKDEAGCMAKYPD